MKKYLNDIFILSGCALVILATALLSGIAALYVTGGMLICAGIFLGRIK